MAMPEDSRLDHLRSLRGVRFIRKLYKAYRPGWDHDHCAACWAKFAENTADLEPVEREGFATDDTYRHGADYDWICPTCFELFKAEMGWEEVGK